MKRLYEIDLQFVEGAELQTSNCVETLVYALKGTALERAIITEVPRSDTSRPGTQQVSVALVLEERRRQFEKWGEQNHDPFVWLSILSEEVGELSEAALHNRFGGHAAHPDNFKKEAIQVAAVALQIVEWIVLQEQNEGGLRL